ncbi:MAG: LegC family aminotransferase [Phycisphaerales bacterium]|jgi:aminotransferase in exopolysaccharide biosynthesis
MRLTISKSISFSAPTFKHNEWKYVKECLDTGWVSSVGPFVDKFEQDICSLTNAEHAVACVNGTAALHTALQIVGVQPDDEVIVPTVTFIAPINAVRYIGAYPIIMDCDDFYNLDILKIKKFIEKETIFRNNRTYNKTTRRCISAVVPVHIFGNAVDMDELITICRERNIKVVEDASESLGTYYNTGKLTGQYTGTVGDIGCYSFNGNKIITTGGGGMIVTNNHKYAQKARYLTTQAKDDASRYIHNEIGYNYRLTNIQAAIGVAQLEYLSEFIETKRNNYNSYKKAIENIPGLHLADMPSYAKNNCWMYALQLNEKEYGQSKETLIQRLTSDGIEVRPLWYLNHLQKPYKNCQTYNIDKAYCMYDKTIMLPCSVNCSKKQLDFVTNRLKQY